MTTQARPLYPTPHPQDAQERQALGFWLYILSDLILFSALFATFAVQMRSFAGGPTGQELFDLPYVFGETLLLLFSSATYGLASRGNGENRCCVGSPSPFSSAWASSSWRSGSFTAW